MNLPWYILTSAFEISAAAELLTSLIGFFAKILHKYHTPYFLFELYKIVILSIPKYLALFDIYLLEHNF